MACIDVAIASCLTPPEPDPDEEPLLDALRARGVVAEVIPWDAKRNGVDGQQPRFQDANLTVLRSTWNYPRAVPAFLRWLEQTSQCTQLVNALPLLMSNYHKEYLLKLEAQGIAVVPTELVRVGESTSIAAVRTRRDWRGPLVVKPAVSAASYETHRVSDDSDEALRRLSATRDVLVQPYLNSVEQEGEHSVMYIDGEFTHAIRKSPRLAGESEHVSQALEIQADQRALAEQVLHTHGQSVSGSPLYARVDMTRGDDGQWVLMELELIEPSLFLLECPLALDRFATALVRLAARPGIAHLPA